MAASRLRVLFRVAAGPRVGFGHLVRATRLAAALDADCSISVAGLKPGRHKEPTWWQGFSPALQRLRVLDDGVRALDAVQPALLVVDTPVRSDSLRWTAAARRRGIAVASIHDHGLAPVPSDLAIDGSVTARDIAGASRTLRGPRYALVDPRCARARRSPGPATVLIALGGGPRRLAAHHIAQAIRRKVPTSTVNIAAGFSPSLPAESKGSVRWLRPQSSLVPHLCRAAVAVVAGGITAYEAASVCVPAVVLAVVPAQRPTVRGLAAEGAVVDSGVTLGRRGLQQAEARVIAGRVARLMGAPNAPRARRLVDGRGIQRVARAFMALARRQGSKA